MKQIECEYGIVVKHVKEDISFQVWEQIYDLTVDQLRCRIVGRIGKPKNGMVIWDKIVGRIKNDE